jgi:hypothetical protein
MSKLHYVGPRVEISHHGVAYRQSKEDKYVYLMVALEILKDIDNDYEIKPSYSHNFKNKALEESDLYTILECYESNVEECITEECEKYKQKLLHELAFIQKIPHLTETDKEIWIKNIEIMKEYRIQRAINKMYYMHCIQNIVQVIHDKKIRVITAPFNQCFFHVFNTLRGALITGRPSLDAKVIEENDQDNKMLVKLYINL